MGYALELARRVGFSRSAPLEVSGLSPLHEVRSLCAPGRCAYYGHSWSCPPACGSAEVLEARLRRYREGLLVQSVSGVEGCEDTRAMLEGHRLHEERLHSLVHLLRGDFPGCLLLVPGPCGLCPRCACPEEPCRHPDRASAPLEAFGLWVSRICRQAGLDYYYGPGTVTYTGCILFP